MNGDKLQRIIDFVFEFGISVALKNAVPNLKCESFDFGQLSSYLPLREAKNKNK